MQQLLDLMKHVLDNGVDIHPDEERTGAGCRSIFGAQLRFDLQNNLFPVMTTRQVPIKSAIRETLWFLKGERNITALKEQGVNFWDDWATTQQSHVNFLSRLETMGIMSPEEAGMILLNTPKGVYGEIGDMYGAMWRSWPRNPEVGVSAIEINSTALQDIPPDTLARGRELWAMMPAGEASDAEREGAPTQAMYQNNEELFLKLFFLSTVDQIALLIKGLKENPYSRRHLVLAYNPAYAPLDNIPANEQPFLGRGSLPACHAFFQVFVAPPATPDGKKRLSLKVELRSWDLGLGAPSNIIGYALMAHLLAREVGYEAHELIVSAGIAHLYANQIASAQEHVQRVPGSPSVIRFTGTKSIYEIAEDDIQITGYVPQAPLNYARNV